MMLFIFQLGIKDPEVVDFLLLEAKCDPCTKNQTGETVTHVLLSNWSDTECVEIIRTLMATRQWDPDSSCNSNDDTALHLCVRHNKLKAVNLLISEVKCDPCARNKCGDTPVHMLLLKLPDTLCVEIIRTLIATKQWDPNSSCNSNDDTALHLCVKHNKLKAVNLLISEVKCDPCARNKCGDTPVHTLLLKLPDTKCVEIIRTLMATQQWDPDSSCNSNDDTALHLCLKYNKLKAANLLISEVKCDPCARNKCGDIPVHTLLLKLSNTECTNIIKQLMETKQWDFNLSYNFNGDTFLHHCVRLHKYNLIYLLLCNAKCDPYIRNKDGETAIHLIISILLDYKCFKVMRYIAKHWNPNSSCNSEGDTALHLSARYHKPEMMQFLLSEVKCDPYIVNKRGETVVKLVMSNTDMWNDYECLRIVKALVATKHWNPDSSCNSEGNTALHLSARYHRLRTVHYLLSKANSNPNSKNINDETPLQLASDTDVINELIRYGSNPNNIYKLYGKSARLREPLRPPVKVFIIGNSGVGKSTLTEALKTEAPLLIRAFATRRRVSNIDEKTAGIVPHDFESKNYGHVTFYDFAGHREFYSSHEAFLHNIIQGSSPIFLIVANISAQSDIIHKNILYWLSFVESQCNAVNCKSHVIVIGSHADIVLNSGNDPRQMAMEISESIQRIFQSSVVAYVGIYPMDCQYFESPGMNKLRYCLVEICSAVRIPKVITFNAHCFHVFVLDKFRKSVAVTIKEIQDQIIKEQNTKEGIAKFLPYKSTTICKVCDELNNRGHLLFLKNSDNIENSWMIIDKAYLLSEVTGTVFAPRDFKQHCQLAESTGVVPLSRFTEHFPDLKTEVLIGFMTHLEFCREILDSELLELITKHHESLNITDTFTSESERYFLFPGLITQQAPDNLWKQNQDFKYHFGWILQSLGSDQFFSSRFLQVLLLRLAFTFALVKVGTDETIPTFQRECSIWKNGIFWGEIFGMETIVEVHSNNKIVILQIRCREEHLLHCIAQRSHIIRRILQCVQDFCPQIKIVDSFIHPSGVAKFPIEFTSEMPQFNVQKIAEAIVKFGDRCPHSVVSARQTILLDNLITFEPYAEIGLSMLRSLHGDYSDFGNKLSNQVLEMLSLKLSRKANLFVEIFRERHLLSSTPAAEELLTVLKQWKDGCEGTYKCLKEKLDQYSIFAGRNILVSSYNTRKSIHQYYAWTFSRRSYLEFLCRCKMMKMIEMAHQLQTTTIQKYQHVLNMPLCLVLL